MDLATFAAEREQELDSLVELYQPAVEEALAEDTEDARTEILLTALAAGFVLLYMEQGGDEDEARLAVVSFIDDMRSAVELLVPDDSDAQEARMTNWFATATLGASTLAVAEDAPRATTAVKTWVTMRDDAVRDIHAQLQGTTKGINETFSVKSDPTAELEYPGQPVGPPAAWINCRCVLSIDMDALVAAGNSGGFSGVVLVALPEGDRRVTYEDGDSTELHQTLAYLGTIEEMQPGEREAVLETASRLASSTEPFTANVAGMATLGEDADQVALTEANELQSLHDGAVNDLQVGAMYAERNGHPTWISHITGLDEANSEVTFDRIGAWFGGDDHTTFQMGEPMEAPAVDEVTDEEAPPIPDEPIDAEDANQPVFGIAAPEGTASGDGREFAPGSLTWRDLPLPLTWQRAAAQEHEGEVVVGRVDSFERRKDGNIWWAGEVFADVPETEELINLLAQQGLRGVSVAADSGKAEQVSEEEMMDAMASGDMPSTVWSEARISGLTIVQIPAFAESFIQLGTENSEALPVPDELVAAGLDLTDHIETFKRGTGWITHPEETSRIHRYWTKGEGAAKIRWGTGGDFTRCTRQLKKYIGPRFLNRTCAQWHHDALGYWPGELGKPGNNPKNSSNCIDCEDNAMVASHSHSITLDAPAPALTIVAAAPPSVMARSSFNDPMFTEPTPFTVRDRLAFGHIAKWGTCHIGMDKVCIEPPHSLQDYAFFHLGEVMTDDGPIAAGSLTLGTGHADLNLNMAGTTAHYDNTGTVVAKVRAGEDDFGIWVAGEICDDVSDEQVRVLQAAGGISGDWRNVGGNLELVAGLAVNVPGFPVPRPSLAASAGRQNSLVAAGFVVAAEPTAFANINTLAEAVVDKIEERAERTARLAALGDIKAEGRAKRVAALQEV